MINGFSYGDLSTTGVFRIPHTNRSVRVRKEIAPLLLGFARDFHLLVEPLDTGVLDDWGYAVRPIRGTTATPSWHGAGIALDVNATRHPMGVAGTFNARQAATIRALAEKYGLRWGGDWKIRPDEMHVEVALKRADALALVKRLQTPAAVKPKPLPMPRPAKLTMWANNSDVALLQKHLAALGFNPGPVDGVYGPKTAAAVKRFQQQAGVLVDGIVGPITLGRLAAKLPH
jgi:hypothetical protein